MFQTFEDLSDPTKGRKRVEALRKKMKALKIDYFVVPRGDEFQNEYVYAGAERLFWLTGFSGSAGYAIIGLKKASIFVDGRYTLQVLNQVDTEVFDIHQVPAYGFKQWIEENLENDEVIGIDPDLHTMDWHKKARDYLKGKGRIKAITQTNPVDQIWKDQPEFPNDEVEPHFTDYAGQTYVQKLDEIRDVMKENGWQNLFVTSPPSLAWLFNIRGEDVPCTPLALGYAVVPVSGPAHMFFRKGKIKKELKKKYGKKVSFHDHKELKSFIKQLGDNEETVTLDPLQVSYRFANIFRSNGVKMIEASDPCVLPKAKKNITEQEGAIEAHLRDGAAVVRFLHWLGEQKKGSVTEICAVKKLEELRRENEALKNISFETISGAGPNGAIVHYRVSESTNRVLDKGSLFLVDSGGQYLDGTTDITRTVAIGKPSKSMIRHFTLVLKGHIALAMAKFPHGTRGCDLDVLARMPLWQAGLDYNHGTGHGVGSYLSVHEGPQGISRVSTVPLEPGMIISNEPGYYREGEYGIRIENLVLVQGEEAIPDGEKPMLSFKTLTKVPLDRKLIDPKLLWPEMLDWLNSYHASVYRELSVLLKNELDAMEWLEKATRPLKI